MWRQQDGFTLLELICVLALLSILMLIAAPRLQSVLQGLELRRDAQAMATVLRSCRSRAVLEEQAVEIRFRDGASPQDYQVCWSGNHREHYSLSGSVHYAGNNFPRRGTGFPTCVFLSDGRSNGGTIVLSNDNDSERLYVIVYPQTARVRVSSKRPT